MQKRTDLPESLLRRWEDAIKKARAYRLKHGDPIEQLSQLLTPDEQRILREIMDEPYS